jgi:type 1 glutamine amidotransferase/sugar phosphate isomerase/epimerase
MKTSTYTIVLAAAGAMMIGSMAAPAQQPSSQPKKAAPGSALEQRTGTTRVSWRVRTLVGEQRLMQWRTGLPAGAFPQLTFTEAAAKADSLGMNTVEGASSQKASPEIQKNLDYNLTAEERTAIQGALKSANVRMIGYRAGALPPDESTQRKALEFAKGMGADTVIVSADAASLASLDKLATELNVNVALDAKTALAGLDNLSKRIGLAVDTGAWMANGVKPVDGLALVKERVIAVNLRDRNAIGARGRDVTIGSGAADMTAFLQEMNRLGLRPLFLTLSPAGGGDGEVAKTIEAFENTVQPVLGAFVVNMSKVTPIKTGDKLPEDVKAKIDAAIPRTAYVKPKKPRKLLVIDACIANMSHNTIPHFNLAIELMAKYTGAFEAVFDNNLDNLKWPKIKEFDAIYLNDTVGELFPDLEVRQSLLRYVREGGGIGGWHGSPWASRSWRELGDMMAAMDAPHRVEPGYLKLDDPKSPINQAFDGTGLDHTEEYYRFHHAGPTGGFYSRDKVHVLLSLDTDKSPAMFKPGRNGQMLYQRPDNDYAVAWIRSYGKGRVFYNSMGHMPETMMSKQIMGHVFAAIQFLVGDLEADTTPSAKLASNK